MDDERGGVLVAIALCHLQFVLHFEHFGPEKVPPMRGSAASASHARRHSCTDAGPVPIPASQYLPASTRVPAEGAEAKSVPEG